MKNKKIFILLLTIILSGLLIACSHDEKTDKKDTNPTKTVQNDDITSTPDAKHNDETPTPEPTSIDEQPTPEIEAPQNDIPQDNKFEKDIKIIKNDSASVEYEDFKHELFEMKIPKGWNVYISGDYYSDLSVLVADNTARYQMFFSMGMNGGFTSQEEKDFYSSKYNDMISVLPVVSPVNAESFFRAILVGDTGLKSLKMTERIAGSGIGGDFIRATGEYQDGKTYDGIFTTSLSVYSLIYVNISRAYRSTYYLAPSEDIINWSPIMAYCLSTFEVTELYQKALQQEMENSTESILETSKIISSTTDIIMDVWESRNKSEDILSQKRQDATMGYDRIYDVDNNKYYEAPLGFLDGYSGSRFVPVTDDGYLMPIDGYITY